MASINPSSDIAAFVNTIYEGALLVARENNLMSSLVTNFTDRAGTATRSNSQYGGVTINQVGETDDLVGQAFTPSVIASLTPYEFGAQYVMTDGRIETDPFTVRADAARDLGLAMATKIDSQLTSQFSSLSGGTVGAAGTAITWGYFYAMLSRMRAQYATGQIVAVFHPYQWHVLAKAVSPGATVTNSPTTQDNFARNFYQQTVAGVDIYTSANITVDGNDDARCAMFVRDALALDIRRAPRLEVERDSSRRAWELNMSAVFAAGVWRPKWGIQGLFDASTPTS